MANTAQRITEINSWHHDWSGLRVGVLGLGVTGFSIADTLVELGATVHVIHGAADADRERLLDVIGATRELVSDDAAQAEALEKFAPDLVMISPGYRPDHPAQLWAEREQIPVWTDIDLGWRLRDKTSRVADWITITGTNGKTTTTQLTAHMLRAGGLRTVPVGNIGTPILDALRDPQGYDVLVVELSSFQLHRLGSISPYASVCLNIAADHLDWHGDKAAYADAKAKVYAQTQVACVYNRADIVTEIMVENADVVEGARAISFGLDTPPPSGFGLVEDLLVDRGFHEGRAGEAYELLTLAELEARGLGAPHLVQNILAAAALARSRGVAPEHIAAAVQSFELDPHRVQRLGTFNGVQWIDDSKATNAHAADASLRASENVVWIVGGLMKGVDISPLVTAHISRLRAIVVIGAEQAEIIDTLQRHAPNVPRFVVASGDTEDVMAAAVTAAAEFAAPGDTVLLSPAAASMDQFTDYADRGRRFQAAVHAFTGGVTDDENGTSEDGHTGSISE